MEQTPVSSIQRRDFPRYATDKPIPITITTTNPQNPIQAKGQTINISQQGLCVKLDADIPVSERVKLEGCLTNTKMMLNNTGRVVWSEPSLSLYGIDLTEYKETIPADWFGYVAGFEAGGLDRRERMNRRTKQEEKKLDARKSGRRENHPALLKCKKYNRAKKLISDNKYYFYRETSSSAKNTVIVENKKCLNFCSNNYLGLSSHPAIIEASIKASQKYGIGTGGSRFLSGTLDVHTELEKKLAKFKGGEDCLIFNTGYMTNLGVISALATSKDDILIVDEKSHASIIDGVKLSSGEMVVFHHNDMLDLEKKLNKYKNKPSKFVLTDGVFSMDGDIAKLDKIYNLANQHNATIFIDDAHSTGVLGKTGKGTAEHFGLEQNIPLIMGTLSKSIGCLGGFIVADKDVIQYLKNTSRAIIFVTSLPANICAAAIKSLEIIETEPEHLQNLWSNVKYLKTALMDEGFDIGITESPIFSVGVGEENFTFEITRKLVDAGLFVNPVIYPAVPRKKCRIRLTVMATHTKEEINFLVDTMKTVFKKELMLLL